MSHPDPTKRTHRASIESSRDSTKGAEIRQGKNERAARRSQERKANRVAAAEQRSAAWRGLTPQRQLAELDKRLGVGQGAAKQRARIAKQIG